MRRLFTCLLVAVLGLLALQAGAQIINEDTTTNQPFFKASKFSSRCYAGFDASVVQVLKNKVGGNVGVNLNWVINHRFVVSAIYDGTGVQTPIQSKVTPADPNTNLYLNHRYVAAGFSYIFFNDKLFSLQPELSAGWGWIGYTYDNTKYHSNFAEVVPAVYATYNCTKYFRFGLGVNYRAAIGANLNGLKGADISGVGGVLFIKVGTF